MKRALKYIGFAGLLIIIASTITVTVSLVWFGARNADKSDGLYSAFGGAAFAYLFVRIGEFFNLQYKRNKLGYDTLVSLEYLINQQLNDLNDFIYSADSIIKTHRNVGVPIEISFNPLHIIEIGHVRLYDLLNLTLINELFDYFTALRKLNLDVTSFERMNDDLRRVAFDLSTKSTTDPQTQSQFNSYVINARAISDMIQHESKAAQSMIDNAIELLAKVRLESESRPLWLQLPIPWSTTKSNSYSQTKIEKEIKNLKDEKEKNTKKK